MKKFYNELQYSLTTEDSSVERHIVEVIKPKKILSACQSGARALALFNSSVEDICISDESEHQVQLLEMRFETIKKLSFEEYVTFWGYPPFGAYDNAHERKKIFNKLNLSPAANDFLFEKLNENNWKAPIYFGRWERTFYLFSVVVRSLLGKKALKLFEFHDLSDQIHFYNNAFPIKRWKLAIMALGNREVFNALIYKGDFVKKNVSDSHFDYFFTSFERLFTSTLARESFFLNMCFFGRIKHKDANPIEATEEVYDSVKKSLISGVNYKLSQKDLLSSAKDMKNIDLISFSDIASYYEGDTEVNFLQELKSSLSKNAILILRHHLRIPDMDMNGFVDITTRFSDVIAKEKVQMFRFQILQLED